MCAERILRKDLCRIQKLLNGSSSPHPVDDLGQPRLDEHSARVAPDERRNMALDGGMGLGSFPCTARPAAKDLLNH